MRRFCPTQIAFAGFGCTALVLWGLAVAAVIGAGSRAWPLYDGGAITASAIAAVCWAIWSRQEADHRRTVADADRTLLIRTLAAVAPAARERLAPTRPLRRVL